MSLAAHGCSLGEVCAVRVYLQLRRGGLYVMSQCSQLRACRVPCMDGAAGSLELFPRIQPSGLVLPDDPLRPSLSVDVSVR